jgi:hypothetical protein
MTWKFSQNYELFRIVKSLRQDINFERFHGWHRIHLRCQMLIFYSIKRMVVDNLHTGIHFIVILGHDNSQSNSPAFAFLTPYSR